MRDLPVNKLLLFEIFHGRTDVTAEANLRRRADGCPPAGAKVVQETALSSANVEGKVVKGGERFLS